MEGQPMQDAWKAYVELALGLTEASRKRATKAAKELIGKGGATAEQLQSLADDLVKTSLANREAITKLIRYELDRALGVVGLATAEEVADLNARVRDLEQQLRVAQASGAPAASSSSAAAPATAGPVAAPAKRTVAKKAVAKKTVAKKAAAGAGVADAPAAGPRKTVAKKAVAKKAVAKKATAKATGAGLT